MSREWASAMAVEWWLIQLSERGEFPARYQVEGLEVVASALREGGTLLCGAHVPHLRLAMRSLIDCGISVGFMVTAAEHISQQGRWLPTGWPQGVTPVVQGPETLLNVRARLQQGELGAMLLDRNAGGPFYPNGMRLAGRLGMRVVLAWTEHEQDGTFRITFRDAPCPVPDTDEKVSANLAVLDAQRTRILAPLLHPAYEQREVSLRRDFAADSRS